MNKQFAIGIPTINRYDLLEPTLAYYKKHFPTTMIYIVDNGEQGIVSTSNKVEVFTSKRNLGVAGSWNYLCKRIFEKFSHALLLNDDIELGKSEEEICQLIDENKTADFIVSYLDWCAFIIPKTTFEEIDGFDECFYPAYFEDNSAHQKMKLKNMSYIRTDVLNPIVFQSSMTIKKEPELNQGFERNKILYQRMWGGLPGTETFMEPFDGKFEVLNIILVVSRVENVHTIVDNIKQNAKNIVVILWVVFDKMLENIFTQWSETLLSISTANVIIKPLLSDKTKMVGGYYHRNIVLNLLEAETDGLIKDDWVYNLDDDNILHPLLIPLVISGYLSDFDIVLFSQNMKDECRRLDALEDKVEVCHVDTGMVLFKIAALKGERFITNDYCADGHLIKKLWEINDKKKIFSDAYSYYNYLQKPEAQKTEEIEEGLIEGNAHMIDKVLLLIKEFRALNYSNEEIKKLVYLIVNAS